MASVPAVPGYPLYPQTTGMTTANLVTWGNWNQAWSTGSATGTTVLAYTLPAWGTWNAVYEETAAQREARQARERTQLEQAREAQVRRQQATARAEELLLSLLTPEQAASRRDRGWFEVRGSAGGRYRIRCRGQAGNVDLLPETGEEREASLCAHPPDGLPDADAHLAQMLALVTDEDGFRQTANITRRRVALAEAA